MKKVVITLLFLLGVLSGLFLMFYHCDRLLGDWFARSRTRIESSSYKLVVEGGIISESKLAKVHIRATALTVKVLYRSFKRHPGGSTVVEVDNLPQGFRVTYRGGNPGFASRGRNSFTLLIPSRRRATTFEILIAPPPSTGSFTFWVGGDNRERLDVLLSLLKRASREKPLFVVLGGDLVVRGLWWQYERLLEVLDGSSVPVFPVPGNHDLDFCGRRLFTRYLAPDHYYFTYGGSLFVVLDTNGREKGQLEWLEGLLKGSHYRHVFVFAHKPPFDPRPGYHHSMGDGKFARGLLALLARYKVDLLFCSHIHSFLHAEYKGLKIIITGGLGAHRKKPLEPFHYVEVRVGPAGVVTRMVPLSQGPGLVGDFTKTRAYLGVVPRTFTENPGKS